MKRGLALLILCGIGLASCSDVPGGAAQHLQAAPGDLLLGDPRLTVAHDGIRRIEFPLVAGPAGSFRERIVTDGQGRYSIRPLEALAGTAAERETFELLQVAREGFLFRYRDFLVRDARLFARNWRTTDLGTTALVAGRTCTLHRVERTSGVAKTFELSLDVQTGLVLASRELDAGGDLVAAMTYESVRFDPDLASVVWHVPANEERPFPDPADAQGTVPGTLRPRLLPQGYGELEATSVRAGEGARWLKRTYSDGVEPLFFFQAMGDAVGGIQPIVQSEAGLGQPTKPRPSSVVVFEVGAATAIQGEVDGFELMVIGRAPKDKLLDLIESSLP